MTIKFKPLADRVLIERDAAEDKSPGGIILPDGAGDPPKQGKVIAVGKGKIKEDGTRQPMDVKVGNKVAFSTFAGAELEYDGKNYIVMSQHDILGIC